MLLKDVLKAKMQNALKNIWICIILPLKFKTYQDINHLKLLPLVSDYG